MVDQEKLSHTGATLKQNFVAVVEELTEKLLLGEEFCIKEIIDAYPQYEKQLREIVSTLTLLTDWGETEPTLEVGTPMDSEKQLGDFRIVREIGRGGMGVVYEAEQISLQRKVALKVLPLASFLEDRQLQRFKNEARAAASLKHPNIVSVYAVGCERSVHFYAMELIDGDDLTKVIAAVHRDSRIGEKVDGEVEASDDQRGVEQPGQTGVPQTRLNNGEELLQGDTVPIAQLSTQHSDHRRDFYRSVARLGVQAAEGLHFAHQQGVIHRDIKPANLIVGRNGVLHITDFGLARIQGYDDLTLSGDLIGTLRYMSPEQVDGEELVDARSDVYSLGLTLYELIVGKPAYDAQSRPALLRQISDTSPVALKKLSPDIPTDLDTIIQKAMAKDSLERYHNAKELVNDLQAFLELRSIRARPSTQFDRVRRFSKRNPALATAVTTGFLLLALLAGVTSLLAWNYSHQANIEATRVIEASRNARLQRIALYAHDMRAAKPIADERSLVELQDILLRWVPEEGDEDLRGFEWFHLWQYCENPALVHSFVHDLPLQTVVFLSDEEIVTSGFASRAKIWSLRAGKSAEPFAFLRTPSTNIEALLYDRHEGKLFLGDSGGNITVFQPATGEEPIQRLSLAEDEGALDYIQTLSHTSDRKFLAVAAGSPEGGMVRVLDAKSGESLLKIDRPESCRAVVNANDELVVSSLRGETMDVYQRDTWDRIRSIPIQADGVASMVISGDRSLVALSVYTDHDATETYRVELWDAANWVRIWSLETQDFCYCLAFSSDGSRLVWGDRSGYASIAELGNDHQNVRVSLRQRLHPQKIYGVAFSPNGRLLATAGSDGFANVWAIEKLSADSQSEIEMVLPRQRFVARGGCYVDDGKTAATACRGVGTYIWNAATGEILNEIPIPSPEHSLIQTASAPEKGLVGIFLGVWPRPKNGEAPPGRIMIWDHPARRIIGDITTPALGLSVTSNAMSPDGAYAAACSHDSGVIIVDVADGKIVHVFEQIPGKSVRFSADSKTLAIGASGGIAHLVAVPDFEVTDSFRLDERLVDCIDISTDGRLVVGVGFDRQIRIFNRESQHVSDLGERLTAFPCLVRFTPDAKRIATASLDGKLRLWITETGNQVQTWQLGANSWPSGEFSRDGRSIVLSGYGFAKVIHAPEAILLRLLSVSELRSQACQNLSHVEW